jgi:hypothetical protein
MKLILLTLMLQRWKVNRAQDFYSKQQTCVGSQAAVPCYIRPDKSFLKLRRFGGMATDRSYGA